MELELALYALNIEWELDTVPFETQTEIPDKPELGFCSVLSISSKRNNEYHQAKAQIEQIFKGFSEDYTVVNVKEVNFHKERLMGYHLHFIHHGNTEYREPSQIGV
jgi:hypothetical protein